MTPSLGLNMKRLRPAREALPALVPRKIRKLATQQRSRGPTRYEQILDRNSEQTAGLSAGFAETSNRIVELHF